VLEDSYVNNNGILFGGPQFVDDEEHKCVVFNGKDQYGEAPPSVADFGELTIDMRIKSDGGKDQRLFDFGTGEDECFYLATTADGKLTLVAKHGGKTQTLVSSQAVPTAKWTTVRVELDGENASISIDGKQAAKGRFQFRAGDVFIGDRPEGNFIACGRDQSGFFQGKMDHFRIYRKVHEDFASLGRVPFPLLRLITKESVEQAKELSAAWEKWRDQRRLELNKEFGYDDYTEKIAAVEEQKKKTESKEEIEKLNTQIKKLGAERHQIWWKVLRALGGNPYSSLLNGDRVRILQEHMEYHTTVDWDGRTREEIEGKVTPQGKEWLLRVRGY